MCAVACRLASSCSLLLTLILVAREAPAQRSTTRESVDSSGTEGNGLSWHPSISADGRVVAFASFATNLAPDPNGMTMDVFVHDTTTGLTQLASTDTSGAAADAWSDMPSISGDGRWVAFASASTNLVPGDTNGVVDIFVKDTLTGACVRVSVDSSGIEANGSCWVAGFAEVGGPSISPDGRYVAFHSLATNLVPFDTNGALDVFWHDRDTDADGVFDEPGAFRTLRVSVDSSGVEGNGDSGNYGLWISHDGAFVTYESWATNLVPGDTNGLSDVFVHELATAITTRVSVSSGGAQSDGISNRPCIAADPSLVDDGRYVTFLSSATTLVPGVVGDQIYLHDRLAGTTELISANDAGVPADLGCFDSAVSADGQYVVFSTFATNLIAPPDGNLGFDVYRRDRVTATTVLISIDLAGMPGAPSLIPRIAAAGNRYAFHSHNGFLVPGDTNMTKDVFVVDDAAISGSRCQPGMAPTRIGTPQAFAPLSPAALGNGITAIAQLELHPIPGLPGVFVLAATVRRAGGPGGWDLVLGRWYQNLSPPRFVLTDHVDALDTAGDEFALSLSDDLRVAVFDSPTGPRYAVRATPSARFMTSDPLGLAGYVDPKLCTISGRTSLAYIAGADLQVAEFDRSAFGTARSPLSLARRLVTAPAGALGLHSPEPLRDASSEARAFLVSIKRSAGVSDSAFVAALDDSEAPRVLHAARTWLNNPAGLGGTTYWAKSPYADPLRIESFGVASVVAPANGGTLRLSAFAPQRPGTVIFAVGVPTLPICARVPGIAGVFGLDPSSFALLGPVAVQTELGYAGLDVPMPALPAGLRLGMQALLYDSATGQWSFSNDAAFVVR